MSRELTFEPFDCDNHYYESEDAFTRHVPEEMKARVVQWAEVDGRKYHVVGGKLSKAVTNPTWDPIAKPGALHKYFRGNPEGKNPMEYLKDREPLPAAYIDRDARLEIMESQNLESIWLFPTLGVLYEELLKDDTQAVVALMRGFNRWIEEDWGFDYKEKIFASPYISLMDIDQAVSELEWCLEKGARTIVMRPAPVWTQAPCYGLGPRLILESCS